MVSQAFHPNMSRYYLKIRSNGIHIKSVIAELATSCKGGLIVLHNTVRKLLACCQETCYEDKEEGSETKSIVRDGRHLLLMVKNNLYPGLTERNAADRCAGTALHTHTLLNASCKAAQRHG